MPIDADDNDNETIKGASRWDNKQAIMTKQIRRSLIYDLDNVYS